MAFTEITLDYRTKSGEPIEIKEVSPDPQYQELAEGGWEVRQFKAFVNGKAVGRLGIRWYPKKNLRRLLSEEDSKFLRELTQHIFLERPTPTFIHVESKWRRQGIALALYQYVSTWLGKRGYPLWASTSQVEGAKAAWRKMKQLGFPVKIVEDVYWNRGVKKNPRQLLDFRTASLQGLTPSFSQGKDFIEIRLNDNGKFVGYIEGVWQDFLWSCEDEFESLKKRFPQITKALVVQDSRLNKEYRGKGVGKSLYLLLMEKAYERGPFVFSPFNCFRGGTTSNKAQRVWSSFQKSFPSEGMLIAVVKKPQVKMASRRKIKKFHWNPKTKTGLPITFKRIEKSKKEFEDDPWAVHRVEALVGGKPVGYLDISYIPQKRWNRFFPTVWHVANWRGRTRLPSIRKPPMTQREIWDVVTGFHTGYGDRTEPTKEQVEKDLRRLGRQYYKEFYAPMYAFHVDKPNIDFIRVNEKWQRQHIAFAMYQEAAQWMAERGMDLWASDTQVDEAKAAWRAMQERGFPIREDETSGKKRKRLHYPRSKRAAEHTKDGREITFERKKSPRPASKPWVTERVDAFVDGKKVGDLDISYIPRAQWKKRFPTVWHHLDFNGTKILPFQNRRELYEKLSRWSYFLTPYRFYPRHNPTDQEIEKDLQKLERNYRKKKYNPAYAFHVDKPLVDYIRVEEDWRRQRVGLALYKEGARWMAERGLDLHASGIQSDEAQAAWKFMKKRKDVPMKFDKGRTRIHYPRPKKVAQLWLLSREDKVPGGLADKKQPEDFDKRQLEKGIKVEREHTEDSDLAKEIAMDHLTEDPKYYDKLEKIEKHAKREIYYHGTGPKNLRRILKQGLLPSGTKPSYTKEEPREHPATKTFGGVYLTRSPSDAEEFTSPTKPTFVIVTLESRSPKTTLDEDGIVFGVLDDIGLSNVDSLFGGTLPFDINFLLHSEEDPESWKKALDIINRANLKSVVETFLRKLVQRHPSAKRDIEARRPKIWKAARYFLTRFLIHLLEGHFNVEDPNIKKPAFLMKTYRTYKSSLEAFLRLLPKATTEGKGQYSQRLRIQTPITYRGKNRIIGVVQASRKMDRNLHTILVIRVFYGSITPALKNLIVSTMGGTYGWIILGPRNQILEHTLQDMTDIPEILTEKGPRWSPV